MVTGFCLDRLVACKLSLFSHGKVGALPFCIVELT